RELRNLAHHRPAVVIHHHTQILLFMGTHVTPQSSSATRAPEKPSYVRVLLQKQLNSLADIFSVEFLGNLFLAIGNLAFCLVERVVKIGSSLLEPFLRHFGIGKAFIDPSSRLDVALFRRELPACLTKFCSISAAHTDQLIFVQQINLDAALFEGARDRLY